MPLVKVVFFLAHPEPLVYEVPEEVELGVRVSAPLRGKDRIGVVVDERATLDGNYEVKRAVPLDDAPLVPKTVCDLINWASSYYLEPLGVMWAAALPFLVREGKLPGERKGAKFVRLKVHEVNGLSKRQRELVSLLLEREEIALSELERVWGISRSVALALVKKGVVEVIEREVGWEFSPVEEKIVLNKEQVEVLDEVESGLGRFSRYLLHGVTGSGKTEVYKRLAQRVVGAGRGVLILVPEIALTPHYVKRFASLFGDKLAVLHSGLSDAERARQWKEIREGKRKVVVGTRSAVFAPIEDCGLIVVDEEHDASYKQQESPRYNARDLAVVRAKLEGCPVVLGSATPSVESYSNALSGRYKLLVLRRRVRGMLPKVEIVDMREERGIFSLRLLNALEEILSRKRSAMILVNRKGYSKVVLCDGCGASVKCPNCDVHLTPHKEGGSFVYICHWCGYRVEAFSKCPCCKRDSLVMHGFGVQKVHEELSKLFPNAKVWRMDRDVVSTKYGRWRILEAMEAGEIDILVGTQMLSKGHHFPRVGLAAIVGADMGLNIPDFRAAERTFQLICQMAGRAGREGERGLVIVQAYDKDHYAVVAGAKGDYRFFFDREISIRRELAFPPFSHLIRVMFVASKEDRAKKVAFEVANGLELNGVELLGPAPCGLRKLKNKYRWHLVLKSSDRKRLLKIASQVPQSIGSVRIFKDVDPYDFV